MNAPLMPGRIIAQIATAPHRPGVEQGFRWVLEERQADDPERCGTSGDRRDAEGLRPLRDSPGDDPGRPEDHPEERGQRRLEPVLEQPVHRGRESGGSGQDSDSQERQEPQVDVSCGVGDAARAKEPDELEIEAADRVDQTLVDAEDQRDSAAGDAGDDVRPAHQETAGGLPEIRATDHAEPLLTAGSVPRSSQHRRSS